MQFSLLVEGVPQSTDDDVQSPDLYSDIVKVVRLPATLPELLLFMIASET